MRFLCVSDQIDPLVYSTSLKERYGDVDAVFCAGDLPMDYVDFIVSALGKPTYFVFGNHDLKEFKIYHKGGKYLEPTSMYTAGMGKGHGGDYLSNKVICNKNLYFLSPEGKKFPLLLAGVSGSIRYNKGEDQYTDFQMFLQLLQMAPALLWNKIRWGRCCDVFLTHASPRHIHDKEDACHKGFECFNWFIEKFKPSLLIHGHIHLYDLQAVRVTESKSTTVVNAYSHIIIDYNPTFVEKKGKLDSANISIRSDR